MEKIQPTTSPAVSVIIPIYNQEKYVEECLDSVLRQTLRELEVICINDGSTDNTLSILREYEKRDSRIIVIDKPNEGVGKTRNLGILKAKGEFVIFMDPDDFYPTDDILESLYTGAKEHGVLVCGGEMAVYADGILSQKFYGRADGYFFESDAKLSYKDYQYDYGFTRFIYNRDLLIQKKISFPPLIKYEDPPFFVKTMISAKEFYALHKIVYGYRAGHKARKTTSKQAAHTLKGFITVINLAKKNKLGNLKKLQEERVVDYLPRLADVPLKWDARFQILRLYIKSAKVRKYYASKATSGKVCSSTKISSATPKGDVTACAWRYPVYRRRYRYCQLMAKVTFGQRRLHYKQKRDSYRQLLRDIRSAAAAVMNARGLTW